MRRDEAVARGGDADRVVAAPVVGLHDGVGPAEVEHPMLGLHQRLWLLRIARPCMAALAGPGDTFGRFDARRIRGLGKRQRLLQPGRHLGSSCRRRIRQRQLRVDTLLRHGRQLEHGAVVQPDAAGAEDQPEQRTPQAKPAMGLAHPAHEGGAAVVRVRVVSRAALRQGGRVVGGQGHLARHHQVSLHLRSRL
nr:hypothetical protein [Rhodoferax sediminis]